MPIFAKPAFNRPKSRLVLAATIAIGLFGALSLPAHAKGTEKGSWTYPGCEAGSPTQKACGAVVMINAGGFEISHIKLEVLSPQGSDYTPAPGCSPDGLPNQDISLVMYEGDYFVFTVPADCGYNGKLKIQSVTTKSKEVFLTPGCQLEMKVTGTTFSNDLHVDVSWTQQAKDAGFSGTVQDPNGLKCGKYNNRS